jgi:hypothetical protein
MKLGILLLKDFFNITLGTWLILVLLEFFNPGMVARFINLEIWFYGLLLVYLVYRLVDR